MHCGRCLCWRRRAAGTGGSPGRGGRRFGSGRQDGVYRRPVRVAERSEVTAPPLETGLRPGDPKEHPLMPALRWARQGLTQIEKIQDYSATLVKRERLGNKLGDYQYMFVKVRHHPFSVYMYFLAPSDVKGREVIYIDGANKGNMWAHGVGIKQTMFGTVSLEPAGMMAMQGQRYPLTELGILNLTRRLVEVAEADIEVRRMRGEVLQGGEDQQPRLHLHPGRASQAAAQLPLPPGAGLRRRRAQRPRPLRGL